MFFRSRLITFSLLFKRKLSTNINFDPCTGCEIPCTKHVSCPPEILKEIDQSTMINSVEKHSRHLCIGQSISSSEWPKHVKDLQGGYMKHLTKIMQEKQNAIGYSIKLTSASMPTKNQSEDTADWYLFPDQIKLVDVNIKQIEEVFEKLFIKTTNEIKCERLSGIWILVCCHFQRDQRCGIIGPILVDEIKKYIQKTNQNDHINCLQISHIGGHRFAGNVIIYPSGTWYGRVLPCHIPLLIDAYTSTSNDLKEKLKPLLRGRIDLN